MQGVVKVGAVDADQHKSLGGQYQIQGFPTIKVFGANKQSPQDYQGDPTVLLHTAVLVCVHACVCVCVCDVCCPTHPP